MPELVGTNWEVIRSGIAVPPSVLDLAAQEGTLLRDASRDFTEVIAPINDSWQPQEIAVLKVLSEPFTSDGSYPSLMRVYEALRAIASPRLPYFFINFYNRGGSTEWHRDSHEIDGTLTPETLAVGMYGVGRVAIVDPVSGEAVEHTLEPSDVVRFTNPPQQELRVPHKFTAGPNGRTSLVIQ